MNHLVIPEKKIEREYPSAWEEIDYQSAGQIGEIMHLCFTGKLDFDMARKFAVDVFLDRLNEKEKPEFCENSVDYWANEVLLADSVDFLFHNIEDKDGVKNVSINPKFCTNLVPYVKVGLQWFVGPKDLLSDLTIYEFKEASWRVGKYAETRDDQYLNEIFAVLYHRGGFIWGKKANFPRSSFEANKNGEREYTRSLLASVHVPLGVKFMIYLYFVGCMNWLREEAIEIDGNEIRFECLFPKPVEKTSGDEATGDNTGMAGILFQMAESGVFGNMEQTSRVSMWDVFLRLYQIHHQIKNIKK
jgi:hypothetical protein